MFKYIIKRLLAIIPVVLGVLFIVFAIMRMAPGDPAMAALGSHYTMEQYEAKREELGLNDPFIVQFVDYVVDVVTEFDLGTSYANKRPVLTEIQERLPVTLRLGLSGIVLTIALGIPLGILAAVRQYSVGDYIATVMSLVLASTPSFWLGLMLIIIFALNLHWLPASMSSVALSTWKHWVLPVVTIGLPPVASVLRFTRSTMLDVVRQDYIRTAHSKGLSEGKVIVKHALRNALLPIVTFVGLMLGFTVAGSVVIESIFSIPGIGSLVTSAVSHQDYPVIQGCVLILSILICLINLVVDLVYGFIDPRIMSMYKSGGKKKKKLPKNTVEEVQA